MSIEIVSMRCFGEPKLKKPTELKGLKPLYNTVYGSKAKCSVFMKDGDLWIKHRDFFSSFISYDKAKEMGLIEGWNKKFVYNDNFGSVVLRNEAWLKISCFDLWIEKPIYITVPVLVGGLLEQMGFGEWNSTMERFFNDVFTTYKTKIRGLHNGT